MAKFNDTSFPSKILSYLANGLQVVTVKIPVVEISGVGDLCTYYEKQNPEDIAEAIVLASKKRNVDCRKRIDELAKKFEKEISTVLTIA